MASDDVARTMGRGLTRWESYQPSTRAATVFGETRRVLEQAPDVRQAAQEKVDTATGIGAFLGGVAATYLNEQSRSPFGRTFGVSARKRTKEVELTTALSMLGGELAGGIAKMKVRSQERSYRDSVGMLVWQVVNIAGRDDDGRVNAYNDALRWRVLDTLELDDRARTRLVSAPLADSLQSLHVPAISTQTRDAIAAYAFHAHAQALNENEAVRRIGPLLVRLGFSKGSGDAFARHALVEYLGESDSLTRHYDALALAVAGIARHLSIPLDIIMRTARDIVLYNPYEAVREQNWARLTQLVKAGSGIASALGGNATGPAMSIAAMAAHQLMSSSASRPAIDGAYLSLGTDANLPAASMQTWLQWNR